MDTPLILRNMAFMCRRMAVEVGDHEIAAGLFDVADACAARAAVLERLPPRDFGFGPVTDADQCA